MHTGLRPNNTVDFKASCKQDRFSRCTLYSVSAISANNSQKYWSSLLQIVCNTDQPTKGFKTPIYPFQTLKGDTSCSVDIFINQFPWTKLLKFHETLIFLLFFCFSVLLILCHIYTCKFLYPCQYYIWKSCFSPNSALALLLIFEDLSAEVFDSVCHTETY